MVNIAQKSAKKQISIQNKTFVNKSDAEHWAKDFERKIETILSIMPKKLKRLSPEKVEELGGMVLFQKLGVEITFLTFKSLVNEYVRQWTGKDENMLRRAEFWLNVFNDKPVKHKAIKSLLWPIHNLKPIGLLSDNVRSF